MTSESTKYKLVPIEPTEEMILAGISTLKNEKDRSEWQRWFYVYDAMLSAAPDLNGEHLSVSKIPEEG